MFSLSILQAAELLTERCLAAKVRMALAESCTGGLAAAAMTALPGSSRVVDRGFVTYSNEAKEQQLGVPGELIREHGAISQPVAMAMAEGALRQAGECAQLAVAITGVAGPDASPGKPVGLVHFAAARRGRRVLHEERQFGSIGRNAIREASVLAALHLAIQALED